METVREMYAGWEDLSAEQKKAKLQDRREYFGPLLRKLLLPGDRMRAIAANCNASEASYTFSHWEGGWIVSKSGVSIAPGMVYSVNGVVQR